MLADPPAILQKRSGELVQQIADHIDHDNGWISFDRFMHYALYTENLGYYAGGMQKFGEDGDFITAPMLGDFFAYALAKQCHEIFQKMATEKERVIIEFGAGNGTLSADLLRQMETHGYPIDRYIIVEISDDLRDRQREQLQAANLKSSDLVSWIQSLPEEGFDGVIIANELLDALPAKKFVMNDRGEAVEIGVSNTGGQLNWADSDIPLADRYQERFSRYDLPEGYQSEVLIQAESWVRSVGEKLNSGVMLLIDYGFGAAEYYHPDRSEGTLMCHYRHHAHSDPFYFPGLGDITVHVDFTAVRDAGFEVGLELVGYAPQSGFLLSLGVLDYLAECQSVFADDAKKQFELTHQIKTLTLPHEMGEIFKVMALSKSPMGGLSGFTLQNHGRRL